MDQPTIDLNDIEALKRRIAELEAQQATTINTGGGAVVGQSVKVRGGHFIGRDFVQTVNNITHTGEDPEEVQSVIAHYLDSLVRDLAGLRLGEIDNAPDPTKQSPLQLADVYVPLDTSLQIRDDMRLDEWIRRESDNLPTLKHLLGKPRPVSALEALSTHREFTLLGKPGSGKSTFGASVLLALAQAWQGQENALAELGETWTQGPLLPIRVILRRFAESLPAGDKPARAGDLWDFIAQDLRDSGYGLSSKAMDYVQRIARQTGAMILLDGLDECGDARKRERVLAAVRELRQSAGPNCRFLLTARPYAWPDGPDPAKGVYALADLNDGQVELFITRWYDALLKRGWRSPGEAERKREDLLQAWWRADMESLARNPLLLTLMATLHSNKGRLPDDRADLYQESVDLLLLRWNRQIGADQALLDALDKPGLKLADIRRRLDELAFNIHEENSGEDGTADIPEHRLVNALLPLLDSKDKADLVVYYIEKRAGLLIGQGEKHGEPQFSFPHRTFQEFLAASHLANQDDFPGQCRRLALTAPAHWQVVLPLAARLANAERGASAADELIGGKSIAEFRHEREPGLADWVCAVLAGDMLQEIGLSGLQDSERKRAILAKVIGWLVAALPVHPEVGGMSAKSRAHAGDVLTALGDPRFDPAFYHLPKTDSALDVGYGFVRIAADPAFKIGTRNKHFERVMEIVKPPKDIRDYFKNEINDETTPTSAFYIARYPVSVAQFRSFMEATGFQPSDKDALRDLDNHPVRYVSWREALAYCDWLNGILQGAKDFPLAEELRLGRLCVTLPSELEWEKAARGGLVETVFPWGDEPDPQRANYADTSLSNTCAVGCFPPNGFGLSDLAGNVWEWTRTAYAAYPPDPGQKEREASKAGNDFRVVRGGSWDDDRGSARCAVRYRDLPGDRLDDIGFRVVLSSSPVPNSDL